MASPLVCTLLFRWILPVFLLAASCLRFNGFSLIYLCCLLAVPLLPNPSRRYCAAGGRTGSFQKAVLGLSSIALIAQVVFQIVLGALPPYGHFFPNCSFHEQLSREIGLSRFDYVDALNIFRLIAPDVIIFVTSLTCVLCSRELVNSSPLRAESSQQIFAGSRDSSTWDNIAPYIVSIMLLIGGIISPSVACSVYFLAFLVFGTLWACHRTTKLREQKAYARCRFGLMVYSMLHIVTLYLYQFQFFQHFVPPNSLISRLVGLIGILHTQCSEPHILSVWHNLDWPQCIAPGVILALYWLLATETRFYFMKDDLEESTNVHWWDLTSRHQRRSASETQTLVHGSASPQRTYNTLNPGNEAVAEEEPVETIRDSEDYPEVQGTLGSVMMFLMRQSYIASLIIMMAWSITYHSWLTFVLLLWACLIWITPFARWFCMVSSPGLVLYAEALLLIQYIYGLHLNDIELPRKDSTGTLDYSELGLKKWKYPFLHLGAQTLFTWVFWMTLRQHIREKEMKKREKRTGRGIPLTSFAHPLVQALRKMSSMERTGGQSASGEGDVDEYDAFASDDAKALMMWIKSVMAKYWILLCCGAFLLVSLQNDVSVYQIGYMAIFLFILLCYQISITTWRLVLRPLWWVMVIYSICILLMIYTYQFDNMPMYWHNATGLSDQWLYNFGLRQHTKGNLLLELLTPTAFSIIIVIQLHFFHRPFMAMIDLRSARPEASTGERATYDAINGTNDVGSSSGITSEHFLGAPSDSGTSASADVSANERPRNRQRSNPSRSLLVVVLVKVVYWYDILARLLWRIGELHMNKLVNLILICVVVYKVCAINAVIIILLGMSMPSRMLQRALSYCFLIWSSLVILCKMVYQLRFVQEDLFQHNCTDQSLPRSLVVNHFTNNARWVGFYKTGIISDDIKGYLLIVLAIVATAVIKHHQKLNRIRKTEPEAEQGVLFSGVTQAMADENLVLCFKYLCNKFFFHYGWEMCMVMIVITMAVRCDVTSVIYSLWLGVFLVLGRQNCSVVWPVYVGFLAILLPIQYLLVLGWPPGLCLQYPWKSIMDPNLVHWLYLTDVVHPQNAKLLIVDFFQLLFACCQEGVFASGRYRQLPDVSAAPSQSARRGSRPRNTTPDFMWNITWLDFFKTIVFQHMYWLTLAIVYITVQSTESIFNFGFILWCFFFLWHGQALYLQPRRKLLKLWKIFIGYSYFTLMAKVCLQLVSCVWMDYVKEKTGNSCWALQLLSMYCLREDNYKSTTGKTSSSKECVAPDDTGLGMDCLCFTFLLMQLRIFSSDYFRHVVREHREQSDMANRGAVIVNEHLRRELEQMRREDKSKMDRIRKSVSRLKDKQGKIGQRTDPQSHYEAIYSGSYYLFESESEGDSEIESSASSSSTSSPRHSPEPIEEPSGQVAEEEQGSGSTGSRSRHESSSSAGDDFVSVPQNVNDIGPCGTGTEQENEGLGTKLKGWCGWIYYYLAMAVDKIIHVLNGISKDYREITEQLRKERKEKRKDKIRRWRLGHTGVRVSQRFAEAANGSDSDVVDFGGKSVTSKGTEDDFDTWSVLTVDMDETDASDWRRSRMRLARFTVALFYALLAHTDIICYMLMILNHMGYASLLSMPLPFLVFLWGMLSIPRPTKNFWIATITYVQVVIVIKYVFKFRFIRFNECDSYLLKEKPSPWCPARLIGIERDAHTSAYDLLLLLALYFHRAFLKVHGLWRDKAYGEDGEENDELMTSPTTPVSEEQPVPINFGLDKAQSAATMTPVEQDPETGIQSDYKAGRRRKSESCFSPVVAFIRRMIDPEIGAGAVDVYAPMFACQFIIFLIILFSWSAFSPEAPTEANFAQIIEENVVPKTFLYMLLTQFVLIIIDRSLYLRKFVLGKLVYLVSLVVLFHVFMFIVVPYVTQKPFIHNVPAIFMYIFKCTYFGLSAYQVRSGYPTRILGNFLTKSFTLTSGVLFQGFQAIPFLLELRSVLDWVCTDTTLTLYHWLKMEDIYANIYVLKCYRESEKTWPHNRGQKYPNVSKLGLGGLLVGLLVVVIWFPLLLMSYINSVYISNLPTDATFSLTIGGYQPLFKVSASEKQFLQTLTDDQIKRFKDLDGRGDPEKYPKAQIDSFLREYRGHGTVVRVKITGNSSSIWTISPPSRRFLMKELLSRDSNITMRFKYEFTREPGSPLVQETISGVKKIYMEPGSKIRRQLAQMLNGTFDEHEIAVPALFPTFVRVPANGVADRIPVLFNGSDVTCGLKLRVGNVPGFTGKVEWWELTQLKPQPIFDPQESVLEMITFNNLVPPLHFSFFASTGIIGLYVGFVWLVGKFVRLFFTSISYRIMFDEMPNVDKVLRLCLDIFMVRECKEFELEEDLFAKLMFLYRSPETLIKWTKYKRH